MDNQTEVSLQIQIMQERIARINSAIYFLPYEKKHCGDVLNALLEKQKETANPETQEKI